MTRRRSNGVSQLRFCSLHSPPNGFTSYTKLNRHSAERRFVRVNVAPTENLLRFGLGEPS